MAYTFFKAMGREVGLSLLELDRVELAKNYGKSWRQISVTNR